MLLWDAIGPGPVWEKVALLASWSRAIMCDTCHHHAHWCHEYTIPWGIWIFASWQGSYIKPRRAIFTSSHQTKRCVLHSVLLMTGLQWVTRSLQSPVWGLRLVHSTPCLISPPHSITAQTRDSIIAISRVSPASLSLSVRDLTEFQRNR